jgi:hypothetical protein
VHLQQGLCKLVFVDRLAAVALLVLGSEHQHQRACHDCLPQQHNRPVGLARPQQVLHHQQQREACCGGSAADADNHECLVPRVYQQLLAQLLSCSCCVSVGCCVLYLLEQAMAVQQLDCDDERYTRQDPSTCVSTLHRC